MCLRSEMIKAAAAMGTPEGARSLVATFHISPMMRRLIPAAAVTLGTPCNNFAGFGFYLTRAALRELTQGEG